MKTLASWAPAPDLNVTAVEPGEPDYKALRRKATEEVLEIEKANTEPFVRYHRFHEEFGRNVRILFGALEAVRRSQAVIPGKGIAATILPAGGEPWGAQTVWRDISVFAKSTHQFLSQMGIVRVMSAFEDFVVGVEAEHERASFITASIRKSERSKQAVATTQENKVAQLYERLDWDITPIRSYMPLFDFFYLARNCIVHRSGRATEALASWSVSPELANSHAAFPTRKGTQLPKLPDISVDKEIQWLPRHAVLASATCYEIAKSINGRLAERLASEGLVYMAAYHSLLAKERVPTGARRSTEIVIRHVLTDRYRVDGVTRAEIPECLRRIGKWRECLDGFQKLKSQETPASR
jgi:hypothetical protein